MSNYELTHLGRVLMGTNIIKGEDRGMTNSELNPDRYHTIRREVAGYLDASGYAADYDQASITEAVADRANSINDLNEDEFNAILQANDISGKP